MEYLVILVLILVGIYKFDVRKAIDSRLGSRFFYFIIWCLILLSGFAYRMGDDGLAYQLEFVQYGDIFDISMDYFAKFPGRLPGWVFLATICKTVCSSYWFFKLTQAIIVNLSISYFIRTHTRYIFIGLLFYYGLLFFELNFGVLRQALSLAIFLYSLKYFYSSKWKKYYLMMIMAFLFHDSSLFLFILPLISKIKMSGKYVLLYILGCAAIIFFASKILDLIATYTVGLDTFSRYNHYIKNDEVAISFANLLFNCALTIGLLFFFARKGYRFRYEVFVIMYIFVYVFAMFTPVIYRLQLFLLPFYFLLCAEFIMYVLRNNKLYISRFLFCSVICLSFLIFKKRAWFVNVEGTSIPHYRYVYPYKSYIFEESDPIRERLYVITEKVQ